jgi:hypothetical protein
MTHKCLTCDGQITKGQQETKVPGKPVRYMHASYDDCREALAGPSEIADILYTKRVRDRGGRTTRLPGLDDMEKW